MSESKKVEYRWGFPASNSYAAQSGGDPASYALGSELKDLDVFVREVLQNANDAARSGPDPVQVHFRLQLLSGEELANFQEVLGWDTIRQHISLVPDEQGGTLKDFVSRVEEREELLLLTIEDRNTHGLQGAEDAGDSNFTALVRDVLYSSKSDDGSPQGLYGLGKAVLWRRSGIRTVLFNSTLPEGTGEGESPRFIGCTRLPTHWTDGRETVYRGSGWLGRPNPDSDTYRPLSLWGESAASLAEELGVSRPDIPGTSITVVGFRDPGRELESDVAGLAEDIRTAAVRHFWPAMAQGRLEVSVETPAGEKAVEFSDDPAVLPFVEAYRGRENPSDDLSAPGDVTVDELEFEIPEREDGSGETKGAVSVSLRRPSPGDKEELVNHVAMFRSLGMVVKYRNFNRSVVTANDFYGVLMAGGARSWRIGEPRESDRDIDEFLRLAEPPAHDKWKLTNNVKDRYKQGGRKCLNELLQDVRDHIEREVAKASDTGQLGPRLLRKKFPLGAGRGGRPSPPTPDVFDATARLDFDSEDKRWNIVGEVGPIEDSFESWKIEISVKKLSEDGPSGDSLTIERPLDLSSDGVDVEYRDGGVVIRCGSDTERLHFEGTTESDPWRGETKLIVKGEVETSEADPDE